jgi:hypothetical protein
MNEIYEKPGSGGDDVATLVRFAGKRPAVPAERTVRVRAAAQAEWRQELQRRSRQRHLWIAAAAVAATCGALAIGLRMLPLTDLPPAPPAATLRVESIAGTAWVRDAGAAPAALPRPIAAGEDLLPGAEITTAEQGRMALRLASGHSVRLDASTRIRWLDARSLALERGALYVDSGPDGRTAALGVHTPLGVVEEAGTQFEVRLDAVVERVRVRLREGAVVVRRDDRVHEVGAGFELELDSRGNPTLRPFPAYGPDWEWIAGVTPMLELEGRSAKDFLAWVARERGWTLAFDDEAAARAAEQIALAGTVGRLTLDEALDAVLPTCRMAHRVEDGVLRVSLDLRPRRAP